MRARIGELVSIDLGPKTELEIEQQMRIEVDAERFTSIDRRLMLEMDGQRTVSPRGRSMFDHVVEVGRLRKLYALGLAEPLEHGRWRIRDGFEETLATLGRRADAVGRMQHSLAVAGVDRGPSEIAVYDSELGSSITGKIISRGICPPSANSNYLIVDGIDGRCHFVSLGSSKIAELACEGAIVRISAEGHRACDDSGRQVREPRMSVELLSAIPIEKLPNYDGATWLDHELVASTHNPRDSGFGREVRSALVARRSWLLEQGLASTDGQDFVCGPRMLAALEQRELSCMASRISNQTGLEFSADGESRTIDGVLRRKVIGASRAFALVENAREFSLVPWRADFESALGHRLSMIVRGNALSWDTSRERGPEI